MTARRQQQLFSLDEPSEDLVAAGLRHVQSFLPSERASAYLEHFLQHVAWEQPELFMYGRRVRTPRLTAWFGDADSVYRYSGILNTPHPWSTTLLELKALVEATARAPFNSVLLNYYRTGLDYLSWHADDEPELGAEPVIASVSLGASRRFALRSIDAPAQRRTREISLEHGSLLLMNGRSQALWQHCIRKEPRVLAPRVNLTFRWIDKARGALARTGRPDPQR